jgi:mono/diheme cytochrome c family protein/glucose/arabinose dehydrogenase
MIFRAALPAVARRLIVLPLAGLAGFGSLPLRAQLGDTLGEGPQTPSAVARQFAPAVALSAAEELKTFQLQPGYRIELVVAEPLVHDPVDAAYDREGNLWVVEFTRFNSGIAKDLPELAKGAQPVPSSKIVKLMSSRHDGHFDRRVEWLTGLERPRGLALVQDGVLIGDPPHLWLARDTTGSGKCDQKTDLAPNFGIPSSDEDCGSLLWGRDNVLHDISYVFDYRYRHGQAQPLPVLMRGQYGVSQDDWGRLFFSRNSDQLRSDLFPPRYNVRNPDATELPWANVKVAHDQLVWPAHPTPAVNRGYRNGDAAASDGGLRPNGRLKEFTAACGSQVYRGNNFPPEVYGQVFVPEPSANLIHLDVLREKAGNIEAFDAPFHQSEFLTSTDSRFRPVNLVNAPDGSMLVVDFYRGLLEEYHMVTSYLREQTEKRNLEGPMYGQGRLWRITWVGGDAAKPAAGSIAGRERAIPADLTDPNSFWRESAQRTLVERGDRSAAPKLEELARHGAASYTRVAALWTLDGLEATTPELLATALRDPESKVRQAAVRLEERFLTQGGDAARDARTALSALDTDPEPEVAIQVALSLGDDPEPVVFAAMRAVLEHGRSPWIAPALVTGLGRRELDFIAAFHDAPAEADKRLLTLLAAAVAHRADSTEVQRLVGLIGSSSVDAGTRSALFAGFDSYFKPGFHRSLRTGAALLSADLAPLADAAHSGEEWFPRAQRLVAELTRKQAEATAAAAAVRPLTAAEQKQYEAGRITFQICAACHQAGGQGLPNVAPSLVESHWPRGDPRVLVRILLNGKEGTVGFPGAMPPIGAAFSDQQIADVLTYVRNSWGLHAGAVAPATVAEVRAQVKGRLAAWQDKDLQRVENELPRASARE